MSTLDLFQDYAPPAPTPTAPYVPNSATSKAAAESVEHALAHLEQVVLDAVKARGVAGATCDEIEADTGLSHQTASARVNRLASPALNVLRRTDDKRPTRSKRLAFVYVAAEHAR